MENKASSIELWELTDAEAAKVAGTLHELKALKSDALLYNNAKIGKRRGSYYVSGTESQVDQIRKDLAAGKTRLMRYQDPESYHRAAEPPQYNEDNQPPVVLPKSRFELH